jgi:hypothetical protein
MSDEATIYLVYDAECPFCSRYVKLLRLRAATGRVELVNARSDHPITHEARRRGAVLDREMVLLRGDRILAGAECLTWLALMSTSSGTFNRLNAALFSWPAVARLAYPVLRVGRSLVLRALGRSRIPAAR